MAIHVRLEQWGLQNQTAASRNARFCLGLLESLKEKAGLELGEELSSCDGVAPSCMAISWALYSGLSRHHPLSHAVWF
jgi:hypothetical protein